MMRGFFVATWLVMALTPAAASAVQRRQTGSCAPRGARTIASDSVASVYAISEPKVRAGVFVRGCVYRSGRIVPIGPLPSCGPPVCGGYTRFRLAGAIVAYEQFSDTDESGEWFVISRDLRSGRRIARAPTGDLPRLGPNYVGIGEALSLVVSATGGIAWIAERETHIFEVHTASARGTKLLASGEDISPRSLAVAGSTIYWTDGAAAKSAYLE
jgi:hypothetical protein